MANFIDLIYSRSAVKEAKEVLVTLEQTHNEILKLSKVNLDFFGGSTPKNPAQLKSIIADVSKLEKAQTQATNKLVKDLERQRLAEIKLQQDREKAFDKYEAQLNKEQAKLSAAQSLQAKTAAQIKLLDAAYSDLALKKQRYNNLTDHEEKRLNTLTATLQKYRTIQDGVNTTVGKYQQRVGNYATANAQLSNSIFQIVREAPAAGNGLQTFFMAISNNAPIAMDAIKNTIAVNKELQSQGQPTTSVLKQIGSALFSFNSLLSIGSLVLILYGKEIQEWAKSLFDASAALDELNDRQKEFNKSRIEGKKNAQEDILNLRKYLSVAKDVNANEDFRNEAVKNLRQNYYYYFKNLTDAQIKNGEYGKSVEELTKALERKGQIELATSLNVTNKQKLIDLEEERSKLLQLEKITQKRLDSAVKSGVSAQSLATISDELNRVQTKRLKIDQEILKYESAIKENDAIIFDLKLKTIALEINEEKDRKKKEKSIKELQLEEEDYYASIYSLRKRQKEIELESNNEIYENESKTYEKRASSFKEMFRLKKDLVNLEYEEQKRLNEKQLNDSILNAKKEYLEVISQEKASKETRVKSLENYNAYVKSANLKRDYELREIEITHNNAILDIDAEFVKKQFDLFYKADLERKNLVIDEQELNDLREHNNKLLNITKNTTKKQLDLIESSKKENASKSQRNRLELELQQISDKLAYELSLEEQNSEAVNKLRKEMYDKQKQLTNLEISDAEKKAEAQKKYLEDISTYMKSFTDDFASSSGLPTLFKILNDEITGFGDNAFVTINATMQAFQEMYAFINQQSEANYQRELERLENQKELAVKYAGDSTTAKEEIERQYEERRRQLERRKAEQEKQKAIFNIIIDTAQAVVGALAEQNYFGAIAFGLLGAAQLAIVNSQQVPAYAEGTENHKGGLMLVNDAKGSKYQETVITPDGKTFKPKGRNVLMNAPKGTKVKTAEWTENLNNILFEAGINGISAPIYDKVANTLTANDLDNVMGKYFANIQTNHTVIDASGITNYMVKNGQKTIRLDNRVSFKGFSV